MIAALGVLLGILVVLRVVGGAGPAQPDAGATEAAVLLGEEG